MVVVSHAQRHPRLALAERTWLRGLPHVFFSDTPSATSPQVAANLPEKHWPKAGAAFHRPSDYKLPYAVLAANESHGGRFKWLCVAARPGIRVAYVARSLGRVHLVACMAALP